MVIKRSLNVSTEDPFYDLTNGYLKPEEICDSSEDAVKVVEAVKIIEDFLESCEESIEGFLR